MWKTVHNTSGRRVLSAREGVIHVDPSFHCLTALGVLKGGHNASHQEIILLVNIPALMFGSLGKGLISQDEPRSRGRASI